MNYIQQLDTYPFSGLIIFVSVIIFVAFILSLANSPKDTKKVLRWIAAPISIAALGLYGYGHGYNFVNGNGEKSLSVFLTSIFRTVLDACQVFVGTNNWENVSSAYTGKPYWEMFFWLVHLLAIATSASAVIVSLGASLLRKIRLRMFRLHDITLIYGLRENTLDFGRELSKKGKNAILYIGSSSAAEMQTAVDQIGAIFRSDPDALSGNEHFLKSIGMKPGKRKLSVYALDNIMISDQHFAKALLTSLEKIGVTPDQTSLTILSMGYDTDNSLQNQPDRYGYGSVTTLNEPDMVARMLIHNYPPYKSITFDDAGLARTDFHAVLVGCGQVGQAVLRRLIMNSQFQGSTSRITIFAPDYEEQIGWISHECREMLNLYNITLVPYDGRSLQFYDYIANHIDTINYIAICTGSETTSLEISEQLMPFLSKRNSHAPVLICNRKGVHYQSAENHITSHKIYTPEILCSDQIDRMAMVINQSYAGDGDMVENWNKCPYFGRMSSRASSDFYSALLYIAGATVEEACKNWDPQGELLENLAANEHLRWNAFHYCMGFRPMTDQEFQERTTIYLAKKAKDPNSDYPIRKDDKKQIHACMIPWEELDAYSQKENAITGGDADYAEIDRNNVRKLKEVLRVVNEFHS